MEYTYDWTCSNQECLESNTSSWDIPARELGHDTLTNYCERCDAVHTHTPLTVEATLVKICRERPTLEQMGELLDAPHDMYDLGYISNTLEQAVMDYLSDEKFVAVYAVHNWAVNISDLDHKYTFEAVAEDIKREYE